MPVHLWIMCEGAAFLFESGKCLHKFLQKESKWPRNLWAWNVAKGRISWHLRRAMGLQLLFQRHYDVSWRWKVNQLCTLNYTTMFHFWFSIADWLFYMETWNVLCWATCSCSVGMFCWPFPLLSICWTDLLVQLTTEPTELTLKKNQPCLGGGGGGERMVSWQWRKAHSTYLQNTVVIQGSFKFKWHILKLQTTQAFRIQSYSWFSCTVKVQNRGGIDINFSKLVKFDCSKIRQESHYIGNVANCRIRWHFYLEETCYRVQSSDLFLFSASLCHKSATRIMIDTCMLLI